MRANVYVRIKKGKIFCKIHYNNKDDKNEKLISQHIAIVTEVKNYRKSQEMELALRK